MKTLFFAAALLATQQAHSSDFVELARAGDMVFGRNAISGQLEISSEGTPVGVPIDAKINYYPQLAFEFEGKPYLLVYDVAANVPSGRRLSRGAEENDLYEVAVQDNTAVLTKVAVLPAGIDIKARISSTGLLCGSSACIRLSKPFMGFPGDLRIEPVAVPPNHEIIEIAGDKLLLQRVYNDQIENLPAADQPIFVICEAGDELEDCTAVSADLIPYDLKEDGSFSEATNGEAVLRFDYDRLGIANYAETNLEARIVWSNVYFLCGIAALHEMPVSQPFRSEIKQRLTREIEGIARLGETVYPGFKVRRYSIDREPIDFLLHYSRIAKTIERARPVVGDALADRALHPLLGQITDPTSTLEEVTPGEIRIRRYMPFWADGSNVPWNFQSAWIEALALTNSIDGHRDTVEAMFATFASEENLSAQSKKWGYAGGEFFDGWAPADDISSNTPSWAGQKSSNLIAHISYRSMDALAMLEAAKDGLPTPLNPEKIADLVSTGFLYPFVNEGLENTALIPFHIARHYSRSSVPWHFQNQAWAIRSIGKLP